jgi:hypothetical protein
LRLYFSIKALASLKIAHTIIFIVLSYLVFDKIIPIFVLGVVKNMSMLTVEEFS